jgi:hypothetical protein
VGKINFAQGLAKGNEGTGTSRIGGGWRRENKKKNLFQSLSARAGRKTFETNTFLNRAHGTVVTDARLVESIELENVFRYSSEKSSGTQFKNENTSGSES